MIARKIMTEHGEIESIAAITHTDNGQVLLHIVSKLGDATHEHKVTIGAEDGKDRVSDMNDEELAATIQKHLDEKRDEAAKILIGRIRVAKIAVQLK